MRIVKDAYTEGHKITFAPDYVAIQSSEDLRGEHVLSFSIEEAKEIVGWLSAELGRVLPEMIPVPWDGQMLAKIADLAPRTPPKKPVVPDICAYDPGPRTATQTVEVKVGDPNLAYRASGGRTATPGDGSAQTIDLGALAAQVGSF